MEDHITKSGESWEALNKRRGRLSAEARKRYAKWRREGEREERARVLYSGAADARMDQALGARFHIHVARTVLSALIEPTPGMLEAARAQIGDANKWRAMVKTALCELDGIY